MNAFSKLQFGPSPFDAPDFPARLKVNRSRARAAKPRVQIVNNIARNQMLRKAGLEFLNLGKIAADRKERLKNRPARLSPNDLRNLELEMAWEARKAKREQAALRHSRVSERMMNRAGLSFIDPSKVGGTVSRFDDINLFDADIEMEEAKIAPVVSLAEEREKRLAAKAPVRRSIFNTRTAIAAVAGAFISMLAGGGSAAGYALNQMDTAEKVQDVQVLKTAPQMSESARILAEIEEEPEYVQTMDCSVPFKVLGKKMQAWGGWEEALAGISPESKKGSVCDTHKALQTRWGNKVADKFEYEAKHVPETSKTVKVEKPKKENVSFAKKMANKAKAFFSRWT